MTSRIKGILVLAGILVVLTGLVLAFRLHGRPADQIWLGYIPFNADLPFFVAVENGYFDAHGVNHKDVYFPKSRACLDALVHGDIDAAMGNSLSALLAIEAKDPGQIKIFLPMIETETHHVSQLLVGKDSDVNGVGELRGKRVGTYDAPGQVLFLRLFLKRFGLDPDTDVQIRLVAEDLQVRALAAGQLDALFTIDPYATLAVEKEGARVLVPFARGQILSPCPGGALAFRTDYLRAHPELCGRVVAALERASEFIDQSPQEAKRALSKYAPVEIDVALKTGVYEWMPLSRIPIGQLQQLADLFQSSDEIAGHVDVAAMLVRPEDLGGAGGQ